MAGKSVFLRQVALISLLAQTGSYVPADEASLGVIDRIFTRVGAEDRLASGESTFMVEMTEAASILNSATERSLVILDEVGRGTSTYDGMSLAWAIAEYLHDDVQAHALRDPLPRADAARGGAAGLPKLQSQRRRGGGRDRVPAQNRVRRRVLLLRRPRGEARRATAPGHRPGR